MLIDKKVVAIIQARVESTRLPGKLLLPINGVPILELLIKRINLSTQINQIVIASPDTQYTDLIENALSKETRTSVAFHRGSSEDIIDRVLNAAFLAKADIIVDITADCPFIDPIHIDYMAYMLLHSFNTITPYDYVSNITVRTWPDGLDVQVYTVEAFQKINNIVRDPKHRCHSGWNFIKYPTDFNIYGIFAPPDYDHYSNIAITLDTLEDYLLISKIYQHFDYDITTSAESIIKYLINTPELLEINKNIIRKTPGEG